MKKDIPQKIRQAMLNDANYKKFIESGDSDKVARYLSMGYLVQSVANAYNEDAIDLMEKYDLVHKKIKTTANNLMQSFDVYDKTISSLIDNKEARLQLLCDYDILRETCDKFMNADIRTSAHDAWQSDELREPGLYLCRVSGLEYTETLLLKWDGASWMQWSPMTIEPYETWISVKCTIVEVVQHVYEEEHEK